MKPPLLPSETFRRVIRVARFDGLSVLGVAGTFALISALWRDVPGAIVGLLVAAAGAFELHGVTLLRAGRARGMSWLISSQLYLMLILVIYATVGYVRHDITLWRQAVTPESADAIRQMGKTVDEVLLLMVRFTYAGVAAATVLYQGGMAIYYLRRRQAVEAAVLEDLPE